MRIRIQNDGQHARMTNITDTETGENINYITRIELTMDAKDQMPFAVLYAALPVVDVIADAEIKHVCPCCGQSTEKQ